MSTTFIATLAIKPGKEAEFEKLQKELSEISRRTEPGTIVYDVIKSRGKPNTYIVYGRFKDEAAFEHHMHAPAHERLVPPIIACVAGEMDLQMYDWKS